MTPEERFEALSDAPGQQIEALADAILGTGVAIEIISAPETVTLPVRLPIPGTTGSTAVIGHAAMTRCAVFLGGVRGDGMRPGRDLNGAVAAAVLDAEVERRGPLQDAVGAIVRDAIEARIASLRQRAAVIAATRLGTNA